VAHAVSRAGGPRATAPPGHALRAVAPPGRGPDAHRAARTPRLRPTPTREPMRWGGEEVVEHGRHLRRRQTPRTKGKGARGCLCCPHTGRLHRLSSPPLDSRIAEGRRIAVPPRRRGCVRSSLASLWSIPRPRQLAQSSRNLRLHHATQGPAPAGLCQFGSATTPPSLVRRAVASTPNTFAVAV
jgi:hypothetical protein